MYIYIYILEKTNGARMDNQEKHATLSIRQKQNKDEQNKNHNTAN
jgi:hypothetical protein